MRIGLISDLHIDINKDYPIVELTAETAAEQMTDVLVIAGDISETQNQTLQAIERLQSLCEFPVYYVPGNHDMWNKNCPECTTEEIDRIYREDLRCLSGKPVILEKDGRQLALDAPEKRPSVISATLEPRPIPAMADVGFSISLIPGPPFGPS